nr:MAG TPA: hypothetical protein [Caudoviricetes sp.]
MKQGAQSPFPLDRGIKTPTYLCTQKDGGGSHGISEIQMGITR